MLALCLVAGCCAPAAAAAARGVPKALRACGDSNEFAPFIYFKRDGGKKTAVVAGLDVDVLHAILGDSGRTVTVELLPWARCLLLGARGHYDIVLDGVKSPVRERDFRLSVPLYALTPVFLYRKGEPPPEVASLADMARHRICSQADYNYEQYGIPNSMITNRARTIDDAATMLRLGRCSLMLQEVEILQAHAALGGKDLLASDDYEAIYPEWLKHIDFHLLVSRSAPYGRELLLLLDQGINRMKKSGEIDRLRNRHTFR